MTAGVTSGIKGNICPNFAYRTITNFAYNWDGTSYPFYYNPWYNNTTYWATLQTGSYDTPKPSFGSQSTSKSYMKTFGDADPSATKVTNVFFYKTIDVLSYPSWTAEWLQYSISTTNKRRAYLGIGYKMTDYYGYGQYELCEDENGYYSIIYFGTSGEVLYPLSANVVVNRNVWDAVALVCYQGNLNLYVNGSKVAYIAISSLPLIGGKYGMFTGSCPWPMGYSELKLGSTYYETNRNKQMDGYMCYYRISNFARYTTESYTPVTWNWTGLEAR